jgi:hypothetical protein
MRGVAGDRSAARRSVDGQLDRQCKRLPASCVPHCEQHRSTLDAVIPTQNGERKSDGAVGKKVESWTAAIDGPCDLDVAAWTEQMETDSLVVDARSRDDSQTGSHPAVRTDEFARLGAEHRRDLGLAGALGAPPTLRHGWYL